MMCKAKTKTWQSIKVRAIALHETYNEVSRYLAQSTLGGPISQKGESLLSNLRIISENTSFFEESVRAEAQVESTYWSMMETEETFKQAASMQRSAALPFKRNH